MRIFRATHHGRIDEWWFGKGTRNPIGDYYMDGHHGGPSAWEEDEIANTSWRDYGDWAYPPELELDEHCVTRGRQ